MYIWWYIWYMIIYIIYMYTYYMWLCVCLYMHLQVHIYVLNCINIFLVWTPLMIQQRKKCCFRLARWTSSSWQRNGTSVASLCDSVAGADGIRLCKSGSYTTLVYHSLSAPVIVRLFALWCIVMYIKSSSPRSLKMEAAKDKQAKPPPITAMSIEFQQCKSGEKRWKLQELSVNV